MNVNTVKLAYFSPTGTTKKILHAIAEGFESEKTESIDLTLPEADSLTPQPINGELLILGVPVYEGRVPATAIPRLKQLKADQSPAVVVVVYGNRDYEDALLELNDLVKESGFLPVAGGAFVGEHSFCTEERPMAPGRPDSDDITAAKEFGAKIRNKLNTLDSFNKESLAKLPGNSPYIFRDRSMMENIAASTLDEKCNLCGDCELLCPVGAITIEDTVKTENTACILCCACVKGCETGARVVSDPMVNKLVSWVAKNFQARREPETFI